MPQYNILKKIAIDDYVQKNGIEAAQDKFNAKKSSLIYIQNEVKDLNRIELLSKVSSAVGNKILTNNLDPNNNRDKGIEYYALLNQAYQMNLFANNGYALTMPGPSFNHKLSKNFDKRLIECFPRAKIIAVEKDRLIFEKMKEHRYKKYQNKIYLYPGDVFEFLQRTNLKFKLIWLDLYGMSDINPIETIEKCLENRSIFAITEARRGYDDSKSDKTNKFKFKPSENFKQIDIIYKRSWDYFPGMQFRIFIYKGGD